MKPSLNLSILVMAGSIFVAGCMKDTSLRDSSSLSQTVSDNATTPDLSKCKIRRIYQLYLPGTRASRLIKQNPIKGAPRDR